MAWPEHSEEDYASGNGTLIGQRWNGSTGVQYREHYWKSFSVLLTIVPADVDNTYSSDSLSSYIVIVNQVFLMLVPYTYIDQ